MRITFFGDLMKSVGMSDRKEEDRNDFNVLILDFRLRKEGKC